MVTLSLVLCVFVAAMGAAGFVLYKRWLSALRRDHSEVWEAIGRPSLLFYGSIEGQRLAHRFISDREYESLDDAPFVKLCRFYRGYVRAYTFTVVAACTSLVLSGLGIGVI